MATGALWGRYDHEANDPYCAWPADAERLLSAVRWRRLVVIGDSVAAGVREPVDGYRDLDGVGRVAEALAAVHPEFTYHNLGERDAVLAEVHDRQLEPALALAPDVVVVAAGGNDAFRRSFHEPRVTNQFHGLLAPFAESGADVITMGLFDLARSGLVPEPYAGEMAERFDRLDTLTREVCAEYGGVHVGNHHHPCAADPGIFASDRVHANARGHAIAAANLVRALAELCERGAGMDGDSAVG